MSKKGKVAEDSLKYRPNDEGESSYGLGLFSLNLPLHLNPWLVRYKKYVMF